MTSSKQTAPLLDGHKPKSKSTYDTLDDRSIDSNQNTFNHEIEKTYFIYQAGHIKGPFSVSTVLEKCLTNDINLQSEHILFCPVSLINRYRHKGHHQIWYTLDELKETGNNQRIYFNLKPIQKLNTFIHQPPLPNKQTKDRKVFDLSYHLLIRILSFIYSAILFTFISLHFIIPLILCCIFYCNICWCSTKKAAIFSPYPLISMIVSTFTFKKLKNRHIEHIPNLNVFNVETHYTSVFCGFICTPILIIMMINFYMDKEWHDKHIANVYFIAYGSFCFWFIVDYLCINSNLWYKHIINIIHGVRITNLHKQETLLVLCSTTAAFPAIIMGYLANYLLYEKLTLQCSENVLSDVCVDNMCCYVVSSHDIHLANMIALFGVVRLLSWIVVKADSALYETTVDTLEAFESNESVEQEYSQTNVSSNNSKHSLNVLSSHENN
eukprot:264121_1